MRTNFFIFLFFAFNLQLFSQELSWAKLLNSKDNIEKYIFEFEQEQNKNFTFLGKTFDSANIDIANQKKYIGVSKGFRCSDFISSYDESNKHKWTKRFERKNKCDIYITNNIDNYGNKIVAFILNDTIKLTDDSLILYPKSKFSKNLVLIKYNPAGSLVWLKEFDGVSIDYFNSKIQINSSNSIIISCTFSDSIKINKYNDQGNRTFYSNSRNDKILLKISKDSTIIWAHHIKVYNTYSNMNNLKIDKNSNIVIIGNYSDSIDFEGQIKLKSFHSNFAVKYNDLGEIIWTREVENNDVQSEFKDVEFDKNNNVYISSLYCYSNIVKLDSSFQTVTNIPISKGQTDLIVKLDSNGHYLKHSKYESKTNCTLTQSFLHISDTTIYFVGYFGGDTLKVKSTNGDLKLINYLQSSSHYLCISGLDLNAKSLLSFTSSNGNISSIAEKFIYDFSVLDTSIYICGLNKGDNDYDFSLKNYILSSRMNYGSPFIAKYSTKLIPFDSIDRGQGNASIKNNSENTKISIYPNPFQDILSIALNDMHKNIKLILSDMNGKVVMESIHHNTDQIYLELSLSSGFYILSIESENVIIHKKIFRE